MSQSIYLDNSATTRVRPEVVDAMLPYLTEKWGNPSSIHKMGRQAHVAIETARQQVAKLLACKPEEIYFTPCGTYSNNVAIMGRSRFAEANGHGRHLITTPIEHSAVKGPVGYLESQGWKVTYLSVDREGLVNPDDLKKAITDETSIVSIMYANNEVGTVQPVEDLVAIAQDKEIYFHTDAVQMAGKLPIDLEQTGVSTLSLSGHKFYAPKGIGVLFVRSKVNLMPLVFGGGQENGLFPGTEALPNIVAIGRAAELAFEDIEKETVRLRAMQKILTERLTAVSGVKITGPVDPEKRTPGHVSVVLPGAEGEALVMRSDMKGVCISSGSACKQGTMEPSSVLGALGLSYEEANGSARITAGHFNDEEEIEKAADILADVFANCPREATACSK